MSVVSLGSFKLQRSYQRFVPLVLLVLLVAVLSITLESISSALGMAVLERFKAASQYATNDFAFLNQETNWSNETTDLQDIHTTAVSISRQYLPKSPLEWCHHDNAPRREKYNGILLVRTPKAGSTTCGSVALRLAKRNNCTNTPLVNHFRGSFKFMAGRNRSKSFLFTTVRNPAQRALSRFSFSFLPSARTTNSSILEHQGLQFLQYQTNGQYGSHSKGKGGLQLAYVAPRQVPAYSFWSEQHPQQIRNKSELIQLVKDVLQHYDFVAVSERMEESIVAMALLMGVKDMADVLTTSSKIGGASYYHTHNKCQKIHKRFTTPAMNEYLNSTTWRAKNYGDYLLHQAAALSLDETISKVIGVERFRLALQRYRALKDLEHTYCTEHAQFPCSSQGIPQLNVSSQTCYIRDFGCNYQCIDHLAEWEKNGGVEKGIPFYHVNKIID